MFNVDWSELLIVAVVAIIVVGPKELPSMLRAFGKTFGQVRRTAREFQSTFNEALREAERQAGLDDIKKDLDQVAKIDPTRDLRKSLSDTKKALGEKVGDAKFPHPDVVPIKGKDGVAQADAPATPPAAEPGAAAASPAPATSEAPPSETPAQAAPAVPPADETTPRAAAGAERR